VCPKVRHLQYKIRRLQYKVSEIQVFAGAALYLYLPENILLATCNFLPNYCFFVLFVPWPVGTGYGCSLLVGSNGFVRTKPYLLILKKNNAPHECGNPKCKAIALGWLSDERFPGDHRHQPAASLANRIAGVRSRVGHPPLMPNCTNWLVSCPATLLRNQGCPVHKLARSWLQERLTRTSVQRASKSKLPIKLSSLGFPECAWANFNFQLFSSQSCKNPKLVKSAQNRLLYVYLTWLAMLLAH